MGVFIKREQDYGLRICIYLGGIKHDQPVSIAQLAKALHITRPIATKIVYQLKQHSIIETIQGKLGGVKLAVKAADLSMIRILEALGFDSQINECIKIPGICPFHASCKVHRYFDDINRVLINQLTEKRISDFI